jgi:O-succinylbenzoic acid--CoA ligase
MILGLEIDIVEPVAHPIFDYEKAYKFCAMIPLQLKHTIDYTDNIATMIVGGSKVTKPLLEKISKRPNRFYETYGMTETITHVAVRQLKSANHAGESFFHALPNVSFSVNQNHCLEIHAPNLLDEVLVTNDVVELKDETHFKWKGRLDHVINSAGIKLFPEQIEDKLQPFIQQRYIIAGVEDATLGEKLVLVVENPDLDKEELLKHLRAEKSFTKFEIPKTILTLEAFVETVNGKIQRSKTLKAALSK